MTEVRLDGVTVRHGATAAVDALSLSVPSGALVSLLGPSGCGKTTTLRAVAGLEPLAAGAVRFDGRDVTRVEARDRGAGLVFQRYALFPHMDVAANVGFGLRVRGLSRREIDARVDAMLATVRLEGLAGRYPAQLSGGQMQRVALARTLVVEPRVLMLDEPFANLDTGLRGEMRDLVRGLQRRLGLTTLFVTHDQVEAMELSDRVAVMLDGRLAQEGTPQTLYRQPADRAVAAFMGAANVFPARREGAGARTAFAALPLARPASGERFDVMLRAEAIAMAPDGAPAPDHAFAGTVAARTFSGASVSYAVRCGDETVAVREAADRPIAVGAAVRLWIEPDRVWTMPPAGVQCGGRTMEGPTR